MALVGDDLYVANTDAVVRFPYETGRPRSTRRRETWSTCRPARSTTTGPRTSSPAPTAARLYATVGSNSNVAENGMAAEEGRAAIWEIDRATGDAAHLRLGPAQPERPGLGAATPARCGPSVNERDELGSDLVPDYMTSVRDGGFYGWPYSYYGDARRRAGRAAAPRPGRQGARAGLRARPAHRLARPGLRRGRAARRALLRAAPSSASTARGTASRRSGYKVIFVPFDDRAGRPARRSTC